MRRGSASPVVPAAGIVIVVIAVRSATSHRSLVLAHQGNGSFSGPGIQGTWRHVKTVQVPDTCGDEGSSFSTPYGWFNLHVSDLDGRLIGTGTVKLRLAC
jgi:hypothetical protein